MTADALDPQQRLGVRFLRGRMDAGGNEILCTAINTVFGVNEIPVAEAIVSPASRQDAEKYDLPDTYAEVYEYLSDLSVGDDVTIRFTIEGVTRAERDPFKGPVDVFKGYLLGWAPLFVSGGTAVRVWIAHPLVALQWASSVTDKTIGAGIHDYNLPASMDEASGLVPYTKGPYTDDITEDLWANLIKPEISALSGYTHFADENGSKVADLLDNYDLSDTLPITIPSTRAILDVRRTLQYTQGTLWERLVSLAKRYQFAIIPTMEGFAVTPYVPALGGLTQSDKPSFTMVQQEIARYQNPDFSASMTFSRVGELNGVTSFPNWFDTESRELFIRYNKEAVDTPTTSFIGTLPSWVSVGVETCELAPSTIGVAGTDRILAAGCFVNGSAEVSGNTPNSLYNQEDGELASKYTAMVRNNRMFKGHTAILRGGLQLDTSPGDSVRFEIPHWSGATGNVRTMFGSVARIGVILNPTATSTSGTWILCDHVRSQDEEATVEENVHTVYGSAVIRRPLIELDNIAPGKETV